VTLSRTVSPACLPPPSTDPDQYIDQPALILGWGETGALMIVFPTKRYTTRHIVFCIEVIEKENQMKLSLSSSDGTEMGGLPDPIDSLNDTFSCQSQKSRGITLGAVCTLMSIIDSSITHLKQLTETEQCCAFSLFNYRQRSWC
jgi:hypothetical protein